MVDDASVPQFGPWRGFGDEQLARALPKLGAFPISGLVRRVRRIADLSQRQLALVAGVSPSTVARTESGALTPSLAVLQRLLGAALLELVVVDGDGRRVLPMGESDDVRDGADRRYPSHLDTILDPKDGEWWADRFGLARPPETFYRDRRHREMARAYSRWEVRATQNRGVPPPPNPEIALRPFVPVDPDKIPVLPADYFTVDEWDEDEVAAWRRAAGRG